MPPPPTAVPAPAQLPADVPAFTGRSAHLARLDALLTGDREPAAVVISPIAGTAGVGKTALAVHWAHRVVGRFPDGQLYVNLRGFDPRGPAMTAAEAVRGFLDAFGVPPQRVPTGLQAQIGLYRSLLAGRRVLVVLDNARDAEQVRPLLPGSPACRAIVTSRNQLSGLVATDGALPLTLDLLTAEEARQVLTRRLGPDRVAAEPAAIDQIITACARLPLALAIVAARAVSRPETPLQVLAGQLGEARGGLDAFVDTDDPVSDVRAVLSWSYHTLCPAAARLFRLLGLHPGPDITGAAAASLAGVPAEQAHILLAELARAHLVSEPAPGRYAFHDLLRAYATELAHRTDPPSERHAAIHRSLDHYLHTAHAADRLLHPHRPPVALPPCQPRVRPEPIRDSAHALAWLTTHRRTLTAAVRHGATTGFDTHAWQLGWSLEAFFDRRGYWHDWLAVQRLVLPGTHRLAQPTAQAHAHRGLGNAYARLGRFPDAHTHLRQALAHYAALSDRAGQAHTRLNLAWISGRQDRHADALSHSRQALELYRAAGQRPGQANALNAVGWHLAQLGSYDQALIYCQQSLHLHQHLGNREGSADALDSLGYAHLRLGHHQQAIDCYQQAADLQKDLGDRYYQADTLNHLGDAHHAAGQPDAARAVWQQALDLLTELAHPDADQVRDRLRELDRPPVTAP